MLAGRPPFRADDVSQTLAEVLKGTPPWVALPADVPYRVRAVLERCLAKDPQDRWRDIGDVRLALDGAFDSPTQSAPPSRSLRPFFLRFALPAFAVGVVAGAGAIAAWWNRDTISPEVIRAELNLPGLAIGPSLALSPDGRTLVYVETVGVRRRLMRRDLSRGSVEPVAGSDGVQTTPFFSPDGQWIWVRGLGSQ
jgi:hypothetical protein